MLHLENLKVVWKKMKESYWAYLLKGMASVYGVVALLGFFGLFFSPVNWFTFNEKLMISTSILTIVLLLRATVVMYRDIKTWNLDILQINTRGQKITLVCKNNPVYTVGSQMSVYIKKEKLEEQIGLGELVDIQQNGYVQVLIKTDQEESYLRDNQSKLLFKPLKRQIYD